MTTVNEYTPIEEIPLKVNHLRQFFNDGKLDSIDYRLDQLRKLYFAIKDNEQDIVNALRKDLNKSEAESIITEVSGIYADLLFIMANLRKWAKPQRASPVPVPFLFSSPKTIKSPLGVVCVISPFNFPFLLALEPIVGAIAAGNTVVLKPSELVPNCSAVLTELLVENLDNGVVDVVTGGPKETTVLLEQKFDKILYTGNGTVAKIIAKKAAETLTPVILELGGKSPAIVTENLTDSQLKIASKRIVFTKFNNAGQICVATDYVLVHRSQFSKLVKYLTESLNEQYPDVSAKTYGHVVHTRAFDRLVNIISTTKAASTTSFGEPDRENLFIPPTLLAGVQFTDSSMKEEIFGPILPIIQFDSLDEAISAVQQHHDTPLALYGYTTNSKEQDKIKTRIRSGAVVFNDGMIHVGISTLPFGGVGTSGYGKYHGKISFEAFSNDRAYMSQPYWIEPVFESKYPPVSKFNTNLLQWIMVPSVWFGRTGKVRGPNHKFFIRLLLASLAGLVLGYFFS